MAEYDNSIIVSASLTGLEEQCDNISSSESLSTDIRNPVRTKDLIISIIFVELLPLITGAVIATIGYNLYFKQSSTILGIIFLIIGVFLLIRNGIIINLMKICGIRYKDNINCPLFFFKLDKDHFWYHPLGYKVPIVQCVFPVCPIKFQRCKCFSNLSSG
tara:strand:- start:480 stop:959 length:480 start_codon:yes stop_codon:yes gene_type:complete